MMPVESGSGKAATLKAAMSTRPSPEVIARLRQAIAEAETTEEVDRLEKALKSGVLPDDLKEKKPEMPGASSSSMQLKKPVADKEVPEEDPSSEQPSSGSSGEEAAKWRQSRGVGSRRSMYKPSSAEPHKKWINSIVKLSRLLSFMLRHAFGIIDEHGYASITVLVDSEVKKTFGWAKENDVRGIAAWELNGNGVSGSRLT